MLQQNPLLFSQSHSISTIMPYTFTTNELDSLRSKLQQAELHSKNSQSIIQLSLNEIRTLQKMIDMTYLQGLNGSDVLPTIQTDMQSPMDMKTSGNDSSPPSTYICHKCRIPGHYIQDCPNVSGRGQPPENYLCRKCNIPGHWIQECPLGNQQDYGKPPPPGYCCHRCGVPGHWIKNCPTNDNSERTGNEREISNYGPRDKKLLQQSQQVTPLTNKTNGYLENNTKETDDLNATINVTQNTDTRKNPIE